MIHSLRQKIENERHSRNILWKFLIRAKDAAWRTYLFSSPFPARGKAFRIIYEKGLWQRGSGTGSSPEYTLRYRDFLQGFLRDHGIKSVVDDGDVVAAVHVQVPASDEGGGDRIIPDRNNSTYVRIPVPVGAIAVAVTRGLI